jgi:hypothetical protein
MTNYPVRKVTPPEELRRLGAINQPGLMLRFHIARDFIAMGEAFRSERHSFSPAIDPIKMLERVIQFAPATDADAMKLLRCSFADYPLSMRVAALDFLLRRRPRGIGQRYSPR